MNIDIENQYEGTIDIDYKNIILSVVNMAADYIACPYECEVSVTIVGNEEIRQINYEQRKIDKETDVLSFPLLEYEIPGDFCHCEEDGTCFHPDTGELMLGDIVISYDKVISQAREYNHSRKREIAFLTAHSMLHLFGYDHIIDEERVTMEKMQNEILDRLGITREN